MVAVDWNDELSIEPATEMSFDLSGFGLGIDLKDNLCLQAAQLMMNSFENAKPISIHLDKQIPIGAGLGGGSSDAACVMNAMNEIWQLEATPAELKELAATVGSDVPFFIEGRPAMAEGRGEKLSEIEIPILGKGEFEICIAMPRDEFVSTSESYARLNSDDNNRADISRLVTQKPMYWWPALVNDFESSVGERHPRIIELKNWMQSCGAEYVSMTGSGAAVFGIFEKGKTDDFSNGVSRFSDRHKICAF